MKNVKFVLKGVFVKVDIYLYSQKQVIGDQILIHMIFKNVVKKKSYV